QQTVERLQVYANLRRDENTADQAAKARYERAVAIAIRAAETLAFVDPELLALPVARFDALAADPALAPYRHTLDDLGRRRPHVRSVEVEQVLAQNADVERGASDAFGALDNADLEYGRVRNERGQVVTLTKARHQLLLRAKDRAVRRAAHETFMRAYIDHEHTLTALYSASVRTDVFQARVHDFPSAREAALFGNNIPTTVYDNLIATIRGGAGVIARALDMRRRVLGVAQLAAYDLHVPLAPRPERDYPYHDAVGIVLDGVGLLGNDYVDALRQGIAERWVDVYETKGKRSGAYSWGAYGKPPVILLNWNGTIDHVFTLAHEAGHAMHSYYADRALPFHEAGYPIFLAEIASTVNEVLLTWRLLAQTPADDPIGRFALLERFADAYMGTVVRQTMFAEFEADAHAMAEAGTPLTLTGLNDLYGSLYAAYTPGVEVTDDVRINWARIPHFYRAFYVYQYATGLSAAISLARAIRDEGEPARRRYLDLLASGGKDYPLVSLQRAGVDLTSPAPVEEGLAEYARVVGEMEQIVDAGALKRE
ncbi:MAG TPA: oligoendopeptidase F, partial [Thermomicrobiales bacterium]|nr:oligoendopeptidase F [Thermomicrobiales bacterium]